MTTTAAILSVVRDLARCLHAPAREVREGLGWCPRCGALSLEHGGWFRSSAAASLERLFGAEARSDEARRAYGYLESHEPFGLTLAELVTRFGMRAVFELVQADLLAIDERDRVAPSPPVGDEEAIARADAIAGAGADVTLRRGPSGQVLLRVVRP